MVMRLVLIRHGDAHAGFHGVIGGPRGCTGLTDRGREQANALRDFLAVSGRVRADVLLSSVIPRAIETAEIIAPGLGIDAFGRDSAHSKPSASPVCTSHRSSGASVMDPRTLGEQLSDWLVCARFDGDGVENRA